MDLEELEKECCHSGCNPCILDVYEEQKKQQKFKEIATLLEHSNILSTVKYKPFLLKSAQIITPVISVYEFQAVELLKVFKDEVILKDVDVHSDAKVLRLPFKLNMGDYLILKGRYLNDENKYEHISRPYTPVLDENDQNNGVFQTIIKVYEKGKMSQFVKHFKVGDIVFWRGPYNKFQYNSNKFSSLVLFGGGTGVVPLYNIAKRIIESDEEIWIKLIASFATIQDILLREHVHTLASFWNFKCEIYITKSYDSQFTLKYGEVINSSKLTKDVVYSILNNYENKNILVVICGSESFNVDISSFVTNFGIKHDNVVVL